VSLGYNGRAPCPRRVFVVSESKQTYSKPLDQQRLLHILLREIVFSGDKIKISLWDLRDTSLSLQETSATDWFANSQIWLPGLDSNQEDSTSKCRQTNWWGVFLG